MGVRHRLVTLALVLQWALRMTCLQQLPTITELCPARSFCTSNATKVFEWSEKNESCCQWCSCRSGCFIVGNCCHDVDISEYKDALMAQPLSCEHLASLLNHGRIHIPGDFSSTSPSSYYKVFTSCPVFILPNDDVRRCNSPAELTDYIPVSSSDGHRMYRNIHCARCLRETGVIKWHVELADCPEVMYKQFTDIDARDDYIVRNCRLNALPPGPDYGQRVACAPDSNTIDTCNKTQLWDRYDADIEHACLTTNTGHMNLLYKEHGPGVSGNVYANVFCYLCNSVTQGDLLDTCDMVDDNQYNYKLPSPTGIRIQWELDAAEGQDSNTSCPTSGLIYDPFMKSCRQVVCSTGMMPVYGECQPTGYTTLLAYKAFFTANISYVGRTPPFDAQDLTEAEAHVITDTFQEHLQHQLFQNCVISPCRISLFNGHQSGTYFFEANFKSSCMFHETVSELYVRNKTIQFEVKASAVKIHHVSAALDLSNKYSYMHLDDNILGAQCRFLVNLSWDVVETCPKFSLTFFELRGTVSRATLNKLTDARAGQQHISDSSDNFTICVWEYLAIMQDVSTTHIGNMVGNGANTSTPVLPCTSSLVSLMVALYLATLHTMF